MQYSIHLDKTIQKNNTAVVSRGVCSQLNIEVTHYFITYYYTIQYIPFIHPEVSHASGRFFSLHLWGE